MTITNPPRQGPEERSVYVRVRKGNIVFGSLTEGHKFWCTPTDAQKLVDQQAVDILINKETKPIEASEKKSSDARSTGQSTDSASSIQSGSAAPSVSSVVAPPSPQSNAKPSESPTQQGDASLSQSTLAIESPSGQTSSTSQTGGGGSRTASRTRTPRSKG